MNDEKDSLARGEDVQAAADEEPRQDSRLPRRGPLIVVSAILLSLLWYLLADRYTPYTSQARVEGFVIGVAPEVAGVVTRVLVANNQQVREGQPLFEIDRSQYEIALNKARSDLENARKQVGAGGAAVEAARATLRAAHAHEQSTRQEAVRLKRLYEKDPGTISVRRIEVAQANWDQARARVTAAEADIRRAIDQMGGDDTENNTILNAALVAVAKAELDLANTVVKAASAGVITDLRTDVGHFAATGHPVLTLVATEGLWINAEFTENNLGHLAKGTAVEIALDVLPGKVFEGEVQSVGLGVGAGFNPPPGSLPSIQNDRDWLRQAQRFPVIVTIDIGQDPVLRDQLRVGGQASVMAYAEGTSVLRLLGKAYFRIKSLLSYAY